jgi:hypothetical protein
MVTMAFARELSGFRRYFGTAPVTSAGFYLSSTAADSNPELAEK